MHFAHGTRIASDAFAWMFALGLWIRSQKRLVLARDRIGIKPLFIHRSGNGISFASEIKALFQFPGVERRINLDALNCYLRLNYVAGLQSMVDGVEKLPRGYHLEWIDGRVTIRRYLESAGLAAAQLASGGCKRRTSYIVEAIRK